MESYSVHTSVRGCHVCKDVWEAALGQLLPCQRESGNIHDPRIDDYDDRLQFRGENELASNRKIREGFLPRKFPAIRYKCREPLEAMATKSSVLVG